MKKGIPIIVEKNGKVEDIYSSLHEASQKLGLHVSTIKWRILQGKETGGVFLRYFTQEESDKVSSMAIAFLNREKQAEIDKQRQVKDKQRKSKDTKGKPDKFEFSGDSELDSSKYSIVHYELSVGRICITPCPYKEMPKPMVGSARCLGCPSYHGRNRTKQQVACSAVNGRTWMK